ncbi:MAG: site-specific integrase [Spirochaetaceae bacterium]|nr:site-specific integrase [Spirochaetaceae bacterium]
MRRFYLFKRKGRPNYYVQFTNPKTGESLPMKSTGTPDKSEAAIVVADWIKNGIPEGATRSRREAVDSLALSTLLFTIRETDLRPEDTRRILKALESKGLVESYRIAGEEKGPRLLDFLEEFWDYERSRYVRYRLSKGRRIGRRHCYEQSKRLHHWRDYFPREKYLIDLSEEDLSEFDLFLGEKELAPKTKNAVISVGNTALKWAVKKKIITSNPMDFIESYGGEVKKRGVLSPAEVQSIFSLSWYDSRSRVGNLIAATCGLRSGEVLALQVKDVESERLQIMHSYSRNDGLKTPKNGETRSVPLVPSVHKEIQKLIEENPHGNGPDRFVFYSEEPDKPMSPNLLRRGLERALIDIKLTKEEKKDKEKVEKVKADWKTRNITFHSWRHYYASNMADRVDLRTVQLATGHKSKAMAAHYADHENEEQYGRVAEAAADAFGNVITFRKEA